MANNFDSNFTRQLARVFLEKFESARVWVRVPRRSWKSKGEVEAWAREELAGGPPTLQAVIPKDHPESGRPATWTLCLSWFGIAIGIIRTTRALHG